MALSAMLIRAGEVEEAGRLIAEVEREVKAEEAALVESINERNMDKKLRSQKMTKLRLAKLLATCMVGASVMAFSVAGIAVASMFAQDDNDGGSRSDRVSAQQRAAREGVKQVRIAGVRVQLTKRQLATLEEVTSGQAGDAETRRFLMEVLPQVPVGLVAQVRDAIISGNPGTVVSTVLENAQVDTDVAEAKEVIGQILKTPKRKQDAKSEAPAEEKKQSEEPPAEEPASGDGEDQGEGGDGQESSNKGDEKKSDESSVPPVPEPPALGPRS